LSILFSDFVPAALKVVGSLRSSSLVWSGVLLGAWLMFVHVAAVVVGFGLFVGSCVVVTQTR